MNKKMFENNKLRFFWSITFTTLQSATTVLLIYFLGNVIEEAVDGKKYDFFVKLTVMIVLTIFELLLSLVGSKNKAILEEKIVFDFRKKILKNIHHYVDEELSIDAGKLNSIILNDAHTMVSARLSSIYSFVGGLTLFVGSLFVMFFASWQIGVIVVVCSLLTTLIPLLMSSKMIKIQFESSENKNEYFSKTNKELNNFKAYRFSNSLNKLQLKISGIDNNYEKNAQKLFVRNNRVIAILTAMSILFQMLVVVISAIFYRYSFISIASLVSVSFLMGNTSGGLQSMIYSIPEYQKAKMLYKKRVNENSIDKKTQIIKSIKLVNFNLQTDKGKIYTNDLNIEFLAGKKYLISGKNGSGKSLLYSTLITQNLFDGKILINDEDYQQNWFEGSAWLLQTNPKIFNGSVIENVTLFSDSPNLKKIRYILEGLKMVELINGLDAQCLSDGQKQRIAIARAIYFDPQWIFLDEALSNLDLQTAKSTLDFISKKCKSICVTTHNEIMEGGWYDETIRLY